MQIKRLFARMLPFLTKREPEKMSTPEVPKSKHEVLELLWRNDDGLQKVSIIIDPEMDEDEVIAAPGESGTMILKGSDIRLGEDRSEDVKKVNTFRFSIQSVIAMRQAGTAPDEVVSVLLKAAGRMR